MSQLPTIDIIEHVLRKPNMYTPNSTVGEIASFLAGYYWVSYAISPKPNGIEHWDGFNFYLREKINPNTISIWKEIEHKFGDDALRQIREFYEDFKKTI